MSTVIKIMSKQDMPDSSNSKDFEVIVVPDGMSFKFHRDHDARSWLSIEQQDGSTKALPIKGTAYITYSNGVMDTYTASLFHSKHNLIKAYQQIYDYTEEQAKDAFKNKRNNSTDFALVCIVADINSRKETFLEFGSLLGEIDKSLLEDLDKHKLKLNLNKLGYNISYEDRVEDCDENVQYLIEQYKEPTEDCNVFDLLSKIPFNGEEVDNYHKLSELGEQPWFVKEIDNLSNLDIIEKWTDPATTKKSQMDIHTLIYFKICRVLLSKGYVTPGEPLTVVINCPVFEFYYDNFSEDKLNDFLKHNGVYAVKTPGGTQLSFKIFHSVVQD